MIDYINETYFFDHKSNTIYKESIISRKKITNLDEEEVFALIKNDNVQLCIHTEQNKLDWINETSLIVKKLKNHINSWDNEKSLSEFENGYCYFAELWKMKHGKKLVLLHYRH